MQSWSQWSPNQHSNFYRPDALLSLNQQCQALKGSYCATNCVKTIESYSASATLRHPAMRSTDFGSTFDDWWPGLLRRCSARLEQLAIQRHCVTDTRHLQAPAEDTSFRRFPYLNHLYWICAARFFLYRWLVYSVLEVFLLNDTLIILVQ